MGTRLLRFARNDKGMTPGAAPTRRLVLAATGALLLPRAAHAQTPKRRRIGYLMPGSRPPGGVYSGAFWQGLRALGYGGEDIAIEERYADGDMARLPDLAAELVRLAPEVILTAGRVGVQAAKEATSTIPIVMASITDPVATGFVASLAHPGSNVTGLSISAPEMGGKWLDLLKTAVPDAKRIAFLLNPRNPAQVGLLQAAQQAARTRRIELLSVEAGTPDEIDGAFAAMKREQADALIVSADPVFGRKRSEIVELAASHKLPAIYEARGFADSGGLISYGANVNDNFRRAASYVDKILKGANPADLPVEQPTRFELVVNLRTARALGLTIPPMLLAGADEIIE
jgi:putative ABC transport system substrate-binding protein